MDRTTTLEGSLELATPLVVDRPIDQRQRRGAGAVPAATGAEPCERTRVASQEVSHLHPRTVPPSARYRYVTEVRESCQADPMADELIYVGDPMCSWCWGFAPVIDAVAARATVPLRIVIGGLRPEGAARPLDGSLRAFLHGEWARIAERTGQPFSTARLEHDDWIYDTMTADTAVVAMRSLHPPSTLRFFTTIQRAFYADGVDVTEPDVYRDLVAAFPVDPERFMAALTDPAIVAATRDDFREARELGATGFPTLLHRRGDEVRTITRGYVDLDRILPPLTDVLAAS